MIITGVLFWVIMHDRTGEETVVLDRPMPYPGTYLDLPRYGFAILVPEGMEVSRTGLGQASEIVLFQGATSTEWFQIFATPYGSETISEERVSKDTGATEIQEIQEVLIGTGQTRASMFWHEHEELGPLREVWFIQNGFLFEVTTPVNFDERLSTIMATVLFYMPSAPSRE